MGRQTGVGLHVVRHRGRAESRQSRRSVLPAHRPLSTIVWYDTRVRAYRFAVVKGMMFSRSLAVNAFSRYPTFAVALDRRVGAVLGDDL